MRIKYAVSVMKDYVFNDGLGINSVKCLTVDKCFAFSYFVCIVIVMPNYVRCPSYKMKPSRTDLQTQV